MGRLILAHLIATIPAAIALGIVVPQPLSALLSTGNAVLVAGAVFMAFEEGRR